MTVRASVSRRDLTAVGLCQAHRSLSAIFAHRIEKDYAACKQNAMMTGRMAGLAMQNCDRQHDKDMKDALDAQHDKAVADKQKAEKEKAEKEQAEKEKEKDKPGGAPAAASSKPSDGASAGSSASAADGSSGGRGSGGAGSAPPCAPRAALRWACSLDSDLSGERFVACEAFSFLRDCVCNCCPALAERSVCAAQSGSFLFCVAAALRAGRWRYGDCRVPLRRLARLALKAPLTTRGTMHSPGAVARRPRHLTPVAPVLLCVAHVVPLNQRMPRPEAPVPLKTSSHGPVMVRGSVLAGTAPELVRRVHGSGRGELALVPRGGPLRRRGCASCANRSPAYGLHGATPCSASLRAQAAGVRRVPQARRVTAADVQRLVSVLSCAQ